MSKLLSVKIVGFNVVGENAVEMIYQFQGSKQRLKRMTSLTEAMKKENRVGKYLQVHVSDEEIRKLFPREDKSQKVEVSRQYNGVVVSETAVKAVSVEVVDEEEEGKGEGKTTVAEPVVEYDAKEQTSLWD